VELKGFYFAASPLMFIVRFVVYFNLLSASEVVGRQIRQGRGVVKYAVVCFVVCYEYDLLLASEVVGYQIRKGKGV
jgi:hypothetical protein